MSSLMDREPALVTGGAMALFAALVTVCHAFDFIDWSPEQSGAVAAVAVIILPAVQGWITRRYVRPVKTSIPAEPDPGRYPPAG